MGHAASKLEVGIETRALCVIAKSPPLQLHDIEMIVNREFLPAVEAQEQLEQLLRNLATQWAGKSENSELRMRQEARMSLSETTPPEK